MNYCYLPLYVFCGDHLLAAKLRPSDIDAAANAGRKVQHVAEENVSTRPTTCSGPLATRQVG
jgi:hypothetical protein